MAPTGGTHAMMMGKKMREVLFEVLNYNLRSEDFFGIENLSATFLG